MSRALVLVVLGALAQVHEARADPLPLTLDVGLDVSSARYNDGAGVASGNDNTSISHGGALRANIGLTIDRDLAAFVHASVSSAYRATLYIADPIPPNEFAASFRVFAAGVGVEKMLNDRAWIAPWLGAIHLGFYDLTDISPKAPYTFIGYGFDIGYDITKSGVHGVAVTAGMSHAGSWSLDQNRDGPGVYVVTVGIEYRLRRARG